MGNSFIETKFKLLFDRMGLFWRSILEGSIIYKHLYMVMRSITKRDIGLFYILFIIFYVIFCIALCGKPNPFFITIFFLLVLSYILIIRNSDGK